MISLRSASKICLLLAAGGAMAGCANLASFSSTDLAVPPDSPVAAVVNEAIRNPGPFPKFSDIPNVAVAPKSGVSAERIAAIAAEADPLRREAEGLPPIDPAQTEAAAAALRDQLAGETPPAPSSSEEIEALARELRARATPPPAPK